VRIASLVPSVTETLSAWDRTPIACTRFCERPDLLHVRRHQEPRHRSHHRARPGARRGRRRGEPARGLRRPRLPGHRGPSAPCPVARWRQSGHGRPGRSSRSSLGSAGPPRAGSRPHARLRSDLAASVDGPWATDLRSLAPGPSRCHGGVRRRGYLPHGPPRRRRRTPPCDVVLAPSEPSPFTKRQLPELESVAPTALVDGKDLFWWGVRTAGALGRLAASLAMR